LSSEIIAEKLKVSVCAFDTAPTSLAQLKSMGVPEPVILAMIRCPGAAAAPAGQGLTATSADLVKSADTGKAFTDTSPPKGYTVSYTKSDRKWKLGLRSESYDKISDYFEKQLTEALEKRGLHRVPMLDNGCCRVVIELLQVSTHQAVIKKPGIDASANVSVTDASNRPVYSKGYSGESRTAMNTWGHLINHAVENAVKNTLADENLIRALATGKL